MISSIQTLRIFRLNETLLTRFGCFLPADNYIIWEMPAAHVINLIFIKIQHLHWLYENFSHLSRLEINPVTIMFILLLLQNPYNYAPTTGSQELQMNHVPYCSADLVFFFDTSSVRSLNARWLLKKKNQRRPAGLYCCRSHLFTTNVSTGKVEKCVRNENSLMNTFRAETRCQ